MSEHRVRVEMEVVIDIDATGLHMKECVRELLLESVCGYMNSIGYNGLQTVNVVKLGRLQQLASAIANTSKVTEV